MWRDPLSWLGALARLRLSGVDTMAEVERVRAEQATVQLTSAPQSAPAVLTQP
jgi:hypothetical protein